MIIISKTILVEFGMKHADATDALNKWYQESRSADWTSFAGIKETFNSVGNDRYVFNIKGNKYRLVAMIFFDIRTMYIRFVGTHKEYNSIDCKTI